MISKFLFPGYVCQKKIVEVKTLQYLDRILCTSTTGNMCFKVSLFLLHIYFDKFFAKCYSKSMLPKTLNTFYYTFGSLMYIVWISIFWAIKAFWKFFYHFFRLNKHPMLLNMSKNVKPITKKPVGLICKIFSLQKQLLFVPQDLKINVNEALKQVKTRKKFVNLSTKQVRFRDYRFRIKGSIVYIIEGRSPSIHTKWKF